MEKTKLTKKELKKIEKREINRKFKEWAELVKERDGNKCVICGNPKRLNAHHIIGRHDKYLRFDIKNGISLCPFHHRLNREFSAHFGSFNFILWLIENRPEQVEYLKSKCSLYNLVN